MESVIRTVVIEGMTLYGVMHRGHEYLTSKFDDQWHVTGPGISKRYPDLATLAADCKAFAGLDLLINISALCALH